MSACRGKQQRTEESARLQAQRATLRTGEQIHAYRCGKCKHWHIGHPRSFAQAAEGRKKKP